VLSAHHEFNDKWALDTTLTLTQWAMLSGTQTAFDIVSTTGAPITVNIQQHYQNSWGFALGGSYRINASWLIRAGAMFDQSPVLASERNVTLPDNNREGLSIGAHYQANQRIGLDAGYMHIFVNNASVSAPLVVGSQVSTANGTYNNSHVDIFGLQASYDFI
jgi:long-chain fatty acid transport protein